MLEQAQEIVHSFNQTYGEVLVRPEAVLPPKAWDACQELMATEK